MFFAALVRATEVPEIRDDESEYKTPTAIHFDNICRITSYSRRAENEEQ